MSAANWITIGVAIATLISGWGQFWVRESLYAKNNPANDQILSIFRSRGAAALIAVTGILSGISILILISVVSSPEPLTRIASFQISALTVLAILNIVFIHSIFTLRRLAILQEEIKAAEGRAKSFAALWN